MVRGVVLLVLLVLFGAFDVPGIERVRVRYLANAGNTCNACRMHEEIRALSLKAIKEQILNKLGLKQAPNMTGRALPRIPPISKLMDMYGMQADQPQPLEPGISHHEEIDEYAAKTESVFALAQPLFPDKEKQLDEKHGSIRSKIFILIVTTPITIRPVHVCIFTFVS